MKNIAGITVVTLAFMGSVSGQAEEKQAGATSGTHLSQTIVSAFKKHDPALLRKLHHPSSPKQIVDVEMKVIRGAIDLTFSGIQAKTIALKDVPVELPAALPDGRQVKFQPQPDGVIKLTLGAGQGESQLQFVLYFPFKTIGAKVYLCPLAFR